MLHKDAIFIGSDWAAPSSAGRLEVYSPATEEPVGSVPLSAPADVDRAVTAARVAFDSGPWPRLSLTERAQYLGRMERSLRGRVEEAARLQVDEMGSPYTFMRAGTDASLGRLAYEAAAMSMVELRETREGVNGKVLVNRRPVGVVGVVIPWNGPVGTIIAKIVAPLLAGCAVILKCAPETPLSAYIVAEAAIEAGVPAGVLSFLAGGRDLGEYLVTHPGIDRVSFTGSSAAGRRVGEVCGSLLRGATLELGGKSAAILLEDVDLDRHLGSIVASGMSNNGQICYATTRVLVPKSRTGEIVDRLVDHVSDMPVGDPQLAETKFGPLVASRQRDRVEEYLRVGREEGARIVLGGGRPADLTRGWFVEPTIFVGVHSSMRIAREEIFGPVLCVQEYDDDSDAVAIANDSDYGLGGAVFTEDVNRGLAVAGRIRTGSCHVNEGLPGGGGGPFGGIKSSGVGRERGREGYDSYFELTSIALPAGFEP